MENCPLSGLPCSNKKSIHVTEVGPDYTMESCKSLCVNCGYSYLDVGGEKITKLVTDVLDLAFKGKPLGKTEEPLPPAKEECCPSCGQTLEIVSMGGRFGCPECYKYFSKFISPILARIHGAVRHVGKRPTLTLKSVEQVMEDKPKKPPVKIIEENLEDLEKAMKEAINKENYEEAAKLRDRIKNLKK